MLRNAFERITRDKANPRCQLMGRFGANRTSGKPRLQKADLGVRALALGLVLLRLLNFVRERVLQQTIDTVLEAIEIGARLHEIVCAALDRFGREDRDGARHVRGIILGRDFRELARDGLGTRDLANFSPFRTFGFLVCRHSPSLQVWRRCALPYETISPTPPFPSVGGFQGHPEQNKKARLTPGLLFAFVAPNYFAGATLESKPS